MLLTITNAAPDATDLGFLLHKHPARVHSAELSFGKAHVFYSEATPARCTAVLVLEVDPVELARGDRRGGAPLEPYVNDRPYVASSFLSVAISRVLATALAGRCEKRPELTSRALPLTAHIAVVPCRGGEALIRKLFEPLGYKVAATRHALDARFPSWGASPYFTVELAAKRPLHELLSHLYVLVPVLDDDKHYFVGVDEIEKLVRRGEGWLATHPERALIAHRYLKHQKGLARRALDRLLEKLDETARAEACGSEPDAITNEAPSETRTSLAEARIGAVLAALRRAGARSVLDLGCGEGSLLRVLLAEPFFERIVGVDVSHRALERAAERLHLDELAARRRERISLLHGSLTYRDTRLAGFDAAALVEVIEHVELARLPALERAVFEFARPRTVIVTTPNAEYNVHFPTLAAGDMRHGDHRFEWTRAEFAAWTDRVAQKFDYTVTRSAIGPETPDAGAPTQMGVFHRV